MSWDQVIWNVVWPLTAAGLLGGGAMLYARWLSHSVASTPKRPANGGFVAKGRVIRSRARPEG